MNESTNDTVVQLSRQINHWTMASERLCNFEMLAAPQAWEGLESYLNTAIRTSLRQSLARLRAEGTALKQRLATVREGSDILSLEHHLNTFKQKYLKTDTTLDFYTDAINTRTSPEISALLRACDHMAAKSMHMILEPLGKTSPPVLTYIDKGLGASILKAGLRLWDGATQSPAAAIKIVRHNLYRPTALIHEAGHQVAHILKWNEELAYVLEQLLKKKSNEIAEAWSGWASEIAADTFAFVHTGYASVAGLHDVISGNHQHVFRYIPLDPHPISYLRLLLGTAFCRRSFGRGPWDAMENVWKRRYAIEKADKEIQILLKRSISLVPAIARICLEYPLQAFKGKALVDWLPTKQICPAALKEFEQQMGPVYYKSRYWPVNASLRLLALNGFKVATTPQHAHELLNEQRQWMLQLGKNTQMERFQFSMN